MNSTNIDQLTVVGSQFIDTSLCQSFEICGIASSIGGNKISFYSIYAPNQNADFSGINLLENGPSLIGGDFNARSATFGDNPNQNGFELHNFIINSNYELSDFSPIETTTVASSIINHIPKTYKKPFFKTSIALNKLCVMKCKLHRSANFPGMPQSIVNQKRQQIKIIEIAIKNLLLSEYSECIIAKLKSINKNANMFCELRKNCGLGAKIPFPKTIYTDDTKNHLIKDEKDIAEKMLEIFTERANEAIQRTSPNDGIVDHTNETIRTADFQIQFNDEFRADIGTNI